MLIDLALLPIIIVVGVLRGGVPAVYREIKDYPRWFWVHWKKGSWL